MKNNTMLNISYVLSIMGTGLVAGLMYAYYCSVNPGLSQVSDKEYLIAMQAINRAILNPVFFATFMGSMLVLPGTAWLAHGRISSASFATLVLATVIYIVGVFGVTIFGNVPLNESLEKFDIASATSEQLQRQRQMFSGTWNRFHDIRTMFSVISFVLATISLLLKSKGS